MQIHSISNHASGHNSVHRLRSLYGNANQKIRRSTTENATVQVRLSVKATEMMQKMQNLSEELDENRLDTQKVANAKEQMKNWHGLSEESLYKITEDLI